MSLDSGQSTGTLELSDYLDLNPADSPVTVHMQLEAVDGITRDVVEALKASLQDLEVGGLLLGRVEKGDRTTVWIERYQRIECAHLSGPHFILDDQDRAELEKAAAGILQGGETAVVGLFRSHTREGLQLEEPDFDLIGRYFSDPSDLVLLLKPENASDISARFYVHESGGAQPIGEAFPFRGRILTTESDEPVSEITRATEIQPAAPVPEQPRRLIPDFAPAAVEPMLFGTRESIPLPEEPPEPTFGERLTKWLPLIAALLLVSGVLWFVLRPGHQAQPAAVVVQNEPARPLGLAVAPGAGDKDWRVSWNPNATALHDARSVQLFVREGDEQTRIDLTPADLATGIYNYQPVGNDVTLRLEVVDNSGRVSAESFRYQRVPASTPAAVAKLTPPPQAATEPTRSEPTRTEPKANHRVPPVVAAGIRPRIKSTTSVDVRVYIDERGRVTSAVQAIKPKKGLEAYLAVSAVQAARQWRFQPARENGKPVPGTQTIHFVFQK
jgi:TonB family protein